MLLLISVTLTVGVSLGAPAQEITCDRPFILNGNYIPEKTKYTLTDIIIYHCKEGFYPATKRMIARCTNTGWEPRPRCTLLQVKPCEFPKIKHGHLHTADRENTVPVGKWYDYSCNDNFVTHSGSFWGRITCTREGWSPAVPCRRKCIFSSVVHGCTANYEEYFQGESVSVECHPGYSLPNEQTSMTCTENGWSPRPRCIVKYCGMPVFENATAVITGARFRVNDTLDYKCLDGYENQDGKSTASMVCGENGWTHLPKCYKSTDMCGRPPSISNGDITSFLLAVYPPGSRIEYQCQAYYQLRGSKYVTCNEGTWSEPPKCMDPCVISEQSMNKNNIQLKGKEDKTYYAKTGDLIEFVCKSGHTAATSQQTFQAVCQEGAVEYPRCE
ncbi:complement factor H-related protein 3-like isoform X2 [Rhinolophus ferrumequinum]|uniref:complement factor H-related protein 3-like isoform X2 n=1 Tax=Rhinolophus ferrumequinum TaxID=59479 RepID=UPI00140F6015|nr:complement factor H-related protein 3-like isoform X2 [Rhinolophus ferrumequinum]